MHLQMFNRNRDNKVMNGRSPHPNRRGVAKLGSECGDKIFSILVSERLRVQLGDLPVSVDASLSAHAGAPPMLMPPEGPVIPANRRTNVRSRSSSSRAIRLPSWDNR